MFEYTVDEFEISSFILNVEYLNKECYLMQ